MDHNKAAKSEYDHLLALWSKYLKSWRKQDARSDHGEKEKNGVHDPRRRGVLACRADGAAEAARGGPAAARQAAEGQQSAHRGPGEADRDDSRQVEIASAKRTLPFCLSTKQPGLTNN